MAPAAISFLNRKYEILIDLRRTLGSIRTEASTSSESSTFWFGSISSSAIRTIGPALSGGIIRFFNLGSVKDQCPPCGVEAVHRKRPISRAISNAAMAKAKAMPRTARLRFIHLPNFRILNRRESPYRVEVRRSICTISFTRSSPLTIIENLALFDKSPVANSEIQAHGAFRQSIPLPQPRFGRIMRHGVSYFQWKSALIKPAPRQQAAPAGVDW
jgi:hypothetical protein